MRLIKELIRLPAKFTIPAKTKAIQAELLSRPVPDVTDAVTQQANVDLGSEIRRLENDVEKLRKELTKPLRDKAKEIDRICEEYSRPLAARREELQARVNVFQDAEKERVRQEELARAERLQELAAPVETNGDVSMQELVAYRAEQEAEELVRAPLPEPIKAKGAATKEDLDWECTDPIALWNARPDLCNPPTPKPSAIRAVCVPECPVPGLRLWWKTTTTIKSR